MSAKLRATLGLRHFAVFVLHIDSIWSAKLTIPTAIEAAECRSKSLRQQEIRSPFIAE